MPCTGKARAGSTPAWGVDPRVNKVHLEQEVEPVGFHEDQTDSETSRCTSAGEGGLNELGLQAEEVLQRWHLEHRVLDRGSALLLQHTAWGRSLPSLLPLENISSSY